MAKKSRALQMIKSAPLNTHQNLSSGELFITLCESGDWTYEEIAEELDVSVDTIKGWATRNIIPKGENRDALLEVINHFSFDDETANQWNEVFLQSWMQKRIGEKSPGKLICQNALNDPRLTRLPALFETDQSLPLATAYVELRLTPISSFISNPLLLETNLSLRQRINKKIEDRYASRKSPQDLIDGNSLQTTLILGSPGAGKSSLLRRIALDIAEGSWNKFKIPLFAEARAYWLARNTGKETSLLSYAMRNMLPIGHNIEEALALLLDQQKVNPFILLVDGLDEIASDSMAVNVIYEELRQLAKSIPWIVTARPAGLMASLGRTQRCEIVELDDDSIEILVDNWCYSMKIESLQLDATHLKAEIFGSPSTREMARNPFLLTALCFIKSIIPDAILPASRIDVYETLLRLIVIQAQHRHGNRKILAPHVLSALEEFSFSLYDLPQSVIQIFSKQHWWQFSQTHPEINTDDFDDNILPSRLLTSWGEADTQFHFLHLSLQEHLIARAMLNRSVDDALERRFSPGWRSVFRFYGALLLQQGREDDFRKLTLTLYKEEDINKLSILTLANIFADAGIRDSKDWIEEDLREELFYGAMSGFDAGPEAMIDVLASLDPEWLENAVLSELDEIISAFEQHSTGNDYEYDGQEFIINGRSLSAPYEKLARARTGSATRIIANVFWGDNQNHALMAAYAYAGIATPSERQKILKKAASISMSDNMALRIFAFALAVHRSEFIPFLGCLLKHYALEANGPFSELLNLIADIGGKDAAQILEDLIIQEVQRLSADEFNAFEASLFAVVRMGGSEAIKILEKLIQMPESDSWKEAILISRFEVDPSCEDEIIAALSKNFSDTISALSGAANFQRLPSERIVNEIMRHIDTDSVSGIMDLVFIESSRLDAGEPPVLCGALFKIAKQLYVRIHDDDDANDRNYLISQLCLIFDALGRAAWTPSRQLIDTIVKNKDSNEALLGSTIDLAGHVYADTDDASILQYLKEILFCYDSDHCYNAALAIGHINIEELFRLQSAETAIDAIEEIAAETDILIFDDFWVDRCGNKTKWKRPPKRILFAYDDDEPNIPQIFSHELSRYGFCLDAETPDSCVAYLIFGSTDEYAADLAEQARRINRYAGNDNPLYEIPANITEAKARILATEIGIDLLSRYDKLFPPSLPIH